MVILHGLVHPRLNLEKMLTKQNQNIFHEEKEAHAKPLLKETHALNIYQINILQILTFMKKVKNTKILRAFLNTFEETEHKYRTRSSKYNFKQPSATISYVKFSVSSRGPQLWNRILSETEKTSQTFSFLML